MCVCRSFSIKMLVFRQQLSAILQLFFWLMLLLLFVGVSGATTGFGVLLQFGDDVFR